MMCMYLYLSLKTEDHFYTKYVLSLDHFPRLQLYATFTAKSNQHVFMITKREQEDE